MRPTALGHADSWSRWWGRSRGQSCYVENWSVVWNWSLTTHWPTLTACRYRSGRPAKNRLLQGSTNGTKGLKMAQGVSGKSQKFVPRRSQNNHSLHQKGDIDIMRKLSTQNIWKLKVLADALLLVVRSQYPQILCHVITAIGFLTVSSCHQPWHLPF